MFGRRATKPPAVFTADTLEEEEILRPSVLTDICNSAKIPLHRLERALMLLQLDHRQATIISESNLFGTPDQVFGTPMPIGSHGKHASQRSF